MQFTKDMLNLYLVTDRTGLNGKKLETVVEAAILGGVSMVQLREKNLPLDQFIDLAFKIKSICKKYQIPFIVNDNLVVAIAVDSDGIHIGQDDLPINVVRQQFGPDKIIGVSAHSLEEALKAKCDGATYLGVGAVFNTSTKNNASNICRDDLIKITTGCDLPVVAIGGINQTNCLQLKNSNIAGIAVVSAIMNAKNPRKAAIELKKTMEEIYD